MLKGKTALITGSLGGIGFATAQALAGLGASVYLSGLGSADTIAARVAELEALGVDCAHLDADLRRPDQIADMIAVNKSDGDNATRARMAASEYRAALNIMTSRSPTWTPPVVLISGLVNQGLDAMWEQVETHRTKLEATGEYAERRRVQQVEWMWSMLEERLMQALKHNPKVAHRLHDLEHGVRDGKVSASIAVDEIAGIMGI